jgi:hypothetical protein
MPCEQISDRPVVGSDRPLRHRIPLKLDEDQAVLRHCLNATAQHLDLETLDIDFHRLRGVALDERVDRHQPRLDRVLGIQVIAYIPPAVNRAVSQAAPAAA